MAINSALNHYTINRLKLTQKDQDKNNSDNENNEDNEQNEIKQENQNSNLYNKYNYIIKYNTSLGIKTDIPQENESELEGIDLEHEYISTKLTFCIIFFPK